MLKKTVFFWAILFFKLIIASGQPQTASDPDIAKVAVYDQYLKERIVSLFFDLKDPSVEVNVPYFPTWFAYAINTNDLPKVSEALEKAHKWMLIAKQNNIQEVSKLIPVEITIRAYLKLDQWIPYGEKNVVFDFIILKSDTRKYYLFQMRLESIDEMDRTFYNPYIVVDMENYSDFKYALSMERFIREINRQKQKENSQELFK
ncbi:MAG: hypothetical protein A2096_04070 [Spirochaetes bacterium GWF1_41_5]|nr:MAG: hypothetical protein A2096_04070 [Spirochaetes bacterium GWF1_41_5]